MTQSRSSGPAEDIVLEAAGARTEEEEMASVNISPTGSEVSQCKLIAEYGRGCCGVIWCWGNVRRWEALPCLGTPEGEGAKWFPGLEIILWLLQEVCIPYTVYS